MREAWRNCIGAVLTVCTLGIASPPSLAGPPPEDFGTAHRISPTGEVIVSWTYNRDTLASSLDIFRVADGKVTRKYDAGFSIVNVEFSLSGRFMCVTGRVVSLDSSGRPEHRSRVAVVDTEKEFARVLFFSGTWIGNFQGRTSKGTSHRCLSPPATMSPKLDFDGRINRMVRIEYVNRRGVKCDPASLPYNYEDTFTQYWDPGHPTRPLMFAKYSRTKQVSSC